MIRGYIKRALRGHHSKVLVRLFQKADAPSHRGHRLYTKYVQPEINAPTNPEAATPGVVVRLKDSELFIPAVTTNSSTSLLPANTAAVAPPTDPRSPCELTDSVRNQTSHSYH